MSKENNQNIIAEEFKMPEEQFGSASFEGDEAPSYTGIVLGVLIVLLAIVLGGLYMWSQTFTAETNPTQTFVQSTTEQNDKPENTDAETNVSTPQPSNNSDELSAIENDLDNTNFDSLDAEMTSIEAELEASSQ